MSLDLKDKKKVVGTKQTKRALQKGEATIVYIAKDADKHVVNDVIQLCKTNSVGLVYVDSMKELGKACGIDVSAATAAIIK